MNYPTKEDFDLLTDRVTRLERRTDEIKAVRVEVASEDTNKRLEAIENRLEALERGQQELKQELHTDYYTLYDTLQEHYNEHTARFEKIEATMATKEDLKNLVETMEERFRDLLIKYLRPGGNGH
jgi:chromosome segregation ATPase